MLPFWETQLCGHERKLGPLLASLTPPPAAGTINSPLPGHLRPVIQLGPHRRWWTARSWGTSGPHLEPRQACPCEALLTWQFKKGSLWRRGVHILQKSCWQAGFVFVWEGVWERTCVGESLAGFNHLVFGSGHLVCRVHHGRNGPP